MELLVAALSLLFLRGNEAASSKPNVVLILADDMGHGDASWTATDGMQTPQMAELKKTNTAYLDNAYVNGQCTPWHLGYCKKAYTPLGRGFDYFYGFYLQGQNYFTHSMGGTYAGKRMSGLDLWDQETPVKTEDGTYSTDLFTDKALSYIEKHVAETADSPLFLYLSYNAPHTPLQISDQDLADSNCAQTDSGRQAYCGLVWSMDKGIGRVVQTLKDNALYDNTVIIFSNDNGGHVWSDGGGASNMPYRGGKDTLWEGGTKGLSFVHSPLISNPGTRTGVIHAVDWYATILNMAGTSVDKYGDGVNQWDMISKGTPENVRDHMIYNLDGPNGAIRGEGNYKLILGKPGKLTGWYAPEKDPVGEETFTASSQQLFDLTEDPYEEHDLIKEDREPEGVRKALKAILLQSRDNPEPSVLAEASLAGDPRGFTGDLKGTWASGWCDA